MSQSNLQLLTRIQAALSKTENCIANTQQTITTTAAQIVLPTGYTWDDISYVFLQIDNQAASPTANCVRFTTDGLTTPTNTVGMKLSDTQFYDVVGTANGAKIKLIKLSTLGAETIVAQIAFYR